MADSHQMVWQHAIVEKTEEVAENIRRIVLRPGAPCQIRPGEHIDIKVTIAGEQGIRSYSVVDAAEDGTYLALSVFRTPASRGGSVFMHTLKPCQVVEITQPLQNFPLRIGAPSYVLLAGGIGITAIAEMASTLHRFGADYRLIYAARSRASMAYFDELTALHGDRLDTYFDDEGKFIDIPTLVGSLPEDTELYMCGPIRLMDAVRRAWAERELDPTNLRYETFGSSGWFAAEPFTVRIPRLGVEVKVNSNESMLEALEREGLDMMSDCRRGECGLCQVDVLALDGSADHRDVFYSDRQKKLNTKMCCCVSRAATAETPSGSLTSPLPVITIDIS